MYTSFAKNSARTGAITWGAGSRICPVRVRWRARGTASVRARVASRAGAVLKPPQTTIVRAVTEASRAAGTEPSPSSASSYASVCATASRAGHSGARRIRATVSGATPVRDRNSSTASPRFPAESSRCSRAVQTALNISPAGPGVYGGS